MRDAVARVLLTIIPTLAGPAVYKTFTRRSQVLAVGPQLSRR